MFNLKYRYFFVAIFFPIILFSQNSIELKDIYPGEVKMGAFTLEKDTDVYLSGFAGNFEEWDSDLIFYTWIIDSDTREEVWNMMDTEIFDEEGLIKFELDIELDKGNYEIYYTGMWDQGKSINSFGEFLGKLFGKSNEFERRHRRKLGVEVNSNNLIPKNPEELADEYRKGAVVSFIRVGDEQRKEKGFTLNRDTELAVYAIGEGRKHEVFDYAWIYDLKSNRRVWTMTSSECTLAGGGYKNIKFKDNISLPAGSYKVVYQTDDSHSFDEWNVYPPIDPQFWGVTIFLINEADAKNIEDLKKVDINYPVVNIAKVRNSELLSQGFTLNKKMDLRILCIGEASYGTGMADYGWIIDADSREIVWEMKQRYTDHAGGASKNRMVDRIIELPKGNYIALYQTDDSHAYRSWNSSKPYDAEKWGISIWAEKEEDKDQIELFDAERYENKNVVTSITRVRDSERLHKSFYLNNDQLVRIYAIGEGSDNDMYDYCWIENANGNIIWEMTYKMTRHAGGASKNRLYDGQIMLKAGEYTVYYRSDDSHSYRDWNSTPPYDSEKYGVTIYKK